MQPDPARVAESEALWALIFENERNGMGEGAAMMAAFEMHGVDYAKGIEILTWTMTEEAPNAA